MIEGNSIMLSKKKNAEMHTNNTKQLVTDYFLLVFLIAVSGIPFFSYTIFWIVGLAAALVVAHLRNSLFLNPVYSDLYTDNSFSGNSVFSFFHNHFCRIYH